MLSPGVIEANIQLIGGTHEQIEVVPIMILNDGHIDDGSSKGVAHLNQLGKWTRKEAPVVLSHEVGPLINMRRLLVTEAPKVPERRGNLVVAGIGHALELKGEAQDGVASSALELKGCNRRRSELLDMLVAESAGDNSMKCPWPEAGPQRTSLVD